MRSKRPLCLAATIGGHEIDRVDGQIADDTVEGLPAGNLFRQGKIARGGHVVLAQLGLAGHVGDQEADLLRRQALLQLGQVMPRDLHRRAAVAGVGLDLLGRRLEPRVPVAEVLQGTVLLEAIRAVSHAG